jgi:hypothetical protein
MVCYNMSLIHIEYTSLDYNVSRRETAGLQSALGMVLRPLKIPKFTNAPVFNIKWLNIYI